jgi:protein-S-isoprenylcysteine O-methyltransferase Ste14
MFSERGVPVRWLMPPVLFVLCVLAMVLLRRDFPVAIWLDPPLTWLGLVPVVGGLAIGLAGVWQFRRHRTRIMPFREAKTLVDDGIYRFTRNPMYLGDVIMLLGLWILLGAVSPVAPVIVFAIVADRWYIRVEEAMLRRKFPAEFDAYCRRTRRWL